MYMYSYTHTNKYKTKYSKVFALRLILHSEHKTYRHTAFCLPHLYVSVTTSPKLLYQILPNLIVRCTKACSCAVVKVILI